jgi:hypothetical protein
MIEKCGEKRIEREEVAIINVLARLVGGGVGRPKPTFKKAYYCSMV